jgi:hypothetical protein
MMIPGRIWRQVDEHEWSIPFYFYIVYCHTTRTCYYWLMVDGDYPSTWCLEDIRWFGHCRRPTGLSERTARWRRDGLHCRRPTGLSERNYGRCMRILYLYLQTQDFLLGLIKVNNKFFIKLDDVIIMLLDSSLNYHNM